MSDYRQQGKPSAPENFAIRPLDKGMVRNVPTTRVEQGAFLDLKNVNVTQEGLERRRGLRPAFFAQELPYPPLQGIFRFSARDSGEETVLAVDSKFLYEDVAGEFKAVYQTYDEGTVDASGSTLTGNDTEWIGDENFPNVHRGDVVQLADGREYVISSVESDTEILLVNEVEEEQSDDSYEIRYAFNTNPTGFVTWAVFEGRVVFCDGQRQLREFDGSELKDLDTTPKFIPRSVTYFADRLWCGGYYFENDDGELVLARQSITWSQVLDKTAFYDLEASDPDEEEYTQAFIDLPYSEGDVVALAGMGAMFTALFQDAIYVGQPTELGGSLPYKFDRFQTQGIGIQGVRGFVGLTDGIAIAGQDDVYYLGMQGDFERFGEPIANLVFNKDRQVRNSQMGNDVSAYRLLLSAGDAEQFDDVWLVTDGFGRFVTQEETFQGETLFAGSENEWTLEVYTRVDAPGVIVYQGDDHYWKTQFMLAVTDKGNMRVALRGTDSIVYRNVSDGLKHRMSVRWDGTDADLFLDGTIAERVTDYLEDENGNRIEDNGGSDLDSEELFIGGVIP